MSNIRDRDPNGLHLYASLEPRLQDALGHPLRREIVRALWGTERALGIAELAAQVGSVSAAEVNYHVQVLRRCEAITGDGAHPVAAGRHISYRSLIGDEAEARAFLRATEQLDREQRVTARRSPRLMAIFRIPRPTRTLRFGLNRKPQGEAG